MNFANLFRIALRALGNNKMRGFLTMLGIIIGVASVITMLAIGQGSKRSIRAQIAEMGSNMIMIHPGADMRGGVRQDPAAMQSLKLDDYQAIVDETRYVSACSPSVSSSGQAIYGSNNYPTSIYGINPDYLEIRKYTLAEGDMFTEEDILGFIQLPQSDPTSYDNNPTLIRNITKNKQRTFCDKVESRGIVYQLIARFLKDAKPKVEVNDNRIQKVLSHIRKNIYKTVDIDSLAAISCLSKDHFIRLFKKEVGNTPLQYINQKKIEKAQLILITEDIPVKNIAYLLAYEDHSYFNRLFKKITGVTPQQYRELYKK